MHTDSWNRPMYCMWERVFFPSYFPLCLRSCAFVAVLGQNAKTCGSEWKQVAALEPLDWLICLIVNWQLLCEYHWARKLSIKPALCDCSSVWVSHSCSPVGLTCSTIPDTHSFQHGWELLGFVSLFFVYKCVSARLLSSRGLCTNSKQVFICPRCSL